MDPTPESPATSVQERFAPASACFGCGPANPDGLRIRSFPIEDGLQATWVPESRHEAFPGILSGGIVSTLLDCHSNWTAAIALMAREGLAHPPVTVTAEIHVRLLRPTPTAGPVHLRSRVDPEDAARRRVVVESELLAGPDVTAVARAVLVAVGPDHPAYGAWSAPSLAAGDGN